MYHGSEITFAVVEIDPNAPLPSHHHDNEQVGLLVRGSLTFTVDGELRTATAGEGWVIPGNTEHAAVAGPDGAVVIETWAPPRRDFQELAEMPAATPLWPE
jgi:quercetin dioxygenase-like cupin family protein